MASVQGYQFSGCKCADCSLSCISLRKHCHNNLSPSCNSLSLSLPQSVHSVNRKRNKADLPKVLGRVRKRSQVSGVAACMEGGERSPGCRRKDGMPVAATQHPVKKEPVLIFRNQEPSPVITQHGGHETGSNKMALR